MQKTEMKNLHFFLRYDTSFEILRDIAKHSYYEEKMLIKCYKDVIK